MPSAEYQTLFQSIADLEASLLDFPASPVEPYSNANLLKCQAFVVFSHAEMQVYFEGVARRILNEANSRYKSSSTVDRVFATLVAFRRPEQVSLPADPLKPHDGGHFDKILQAAIRAQGTAISENNGIKRANLAKILMPLGVLPNDFSEPLLIQTDQTGAKRGDMVHKASRVALKTIRDPFADELSDIKTLLLEIGKFDAKIEALGLLSVPTGSAVMGASSTVSR